MSELEREKGQYLGTEVNGRWWKTYRRDGLSLRGNGHYWIENDALMFHRLLTKEPFRIPLAAITGARIGSRHGGKWLAGSPIVKIDWTASDGTRLSNGIGVRQREAAEALVELLRQLTEDT
jgi:hypothetical protein